MLNLGQDWQDDRQEGKQDHNHDDHLDQCQPMSLIHFLLRQLLGSLSQALSTYCAYQKFLDPDDDKGSARGGFSTPLQISSI